MAIQECKYYFLNQTMVNGELAMKHREVISENSINVGGEKLFTITFKQILQDFNNRNWNGRIYTSDIVLKGLDNNPLIQHDIANKTWTGEYGHPIIEKGMNELSRQMTIFPPNACWTIDKYWMEGNLLMGQCTTLSGGYGDIVRNRVLTNYPAMASSRAIGGVDKNGNVLPGYTPITFDCVIRPSHKVAYMVKGSERTNDFPIHTAQANTMSESAVGLNINDPAFADFLLTESTSKQQISMLCESFQLDVDTMTVDRKHVTFNSLTENGMNTIVIPIRQLVGAEYFNLFM